MRSLVGERAGVRGHFVAKIAAGRWRCPNDTTVQPLKGARLDYLAPGGIPSLPCHLCGGPVPLADAESKIIGRVIGIYVGAE